MARSEALIIHDRARIINRLRRCNLLNVNDKKVCLRKPRGVVPINFEVKFAGGAVDDFHSASRGSRPQSSQGPSIVVPPRPLEAHRIAMRGVPREVLQALRC